LPGQVGYWASWKEFNFSSNNANMTDQDMQKVYEIADYVKANPSLIIGIDGTAKKSRDQSLNDQRINAIRSALIDVGVSPTKITTGAMDNKDLRRDGRIAVLFTTA